MRTILVATDFSASAKNASEYAIDLAKHLHTSVELVHAFDVPFTFSDSGMQYIDIEEIEKNTQESLVAEVERLKELNPSVEVKFQSCIGRIIDCINDISSRIKPCLIVFGMSGENDSFLWGSTAITALRSFNVPVLIVPKNAKWAGVQHLCYAVNYQKVNENTPFHYIKEWAKLFSGQLTVFNVHKVHEYAEPPANLKEALKDMNPRYESWESDNFEIGMQNFLSANNFDWLVIIPQKHGFFDRLRHNSRSRQITKVSSIPVLSFYEK